MRKEFAEAVISLCRSNDRLVFLTGDLGFMALEGVRDELGDRFINAGVAEQNMVTMAAALAHEGFLPIVYSISPFVTLRPYEQLRNDVCLHNLPVKVVANGGGYGYGIMGSTHHNIEDIGSMRLLPNMHVFVPFTSTDVRACLSAMMSLSTPSYLRLNLASKQTGIEAFSPWRQIRRNERAKAIIVATGSVAEYLFALPETVLQHLDIWLVSQFPITEMPSALVERISNTPHVITIEEHRGQCGLNETLAVFLLKQVSRSIKYDTLFATGYPSGKYGSQEWHLQENGLAGHPLQQRLENFLNMTHA